MCSTRLGSPGRRGPRSSFTRSHRLLAVNLSAPSSWSAAMRNCSSSSVPTASMFGYQRNLQLNSLMHFASSSLEASVMSSCYDTPKILCEAEISGQPLTRASTQILLGVWRLDGPAATRIPRMYAEPKLLYPMDLGITIATSNGTWQIKFPRSHMGCLLAAY